MKILTSPILLAALVSTASGAQAQPAAAPPPALAQRGGWQPVVSVSTSERGLALRSELITSHSVAGGSGSSQGAEAGVAPEAASSRRDGSSLGRALSDSIAPFGIASGAFLLLDGKHHRGQTRGAVEGIAATAAITGLLKYAVHEERPRGGPHSFPSGHASFAFALATAVGENHRGARLPLFALATAIAASRVDVRAHHVHDVIAGAAIGYFTTRYFLRRSLRSSSSEPATSASPAPSRNGLSLSPSGVSFARSF